MVQVQSVNGLRPVRPGPPSKHVRRVEMGYMYSQGGGPGKDPDIVPAFGCGMVLGCIVALLLLALAKGLSM